MKGEKMFEIAFYRDTNGNEPVKNYIDSLQAKADRSKDSRIKLTKIFTYLELLSENGTHIGAPYVKHIEGEIWELRPLRDRIFFFAWRKNIFVLLHCFVKKTQKTPAKEISQAKRNMQSFIERNK
jgi:phage-related protein